MTSKVKPIELLKSLLILASGILLNQNIMGQGLITSPGSSVISSGGSIALQGDLVNNGSIINSNNKIFFNGVTQSLTGTSPVLFNNLTVASGSTTTILTAGQTLSSILLSNGVLNAGGNITLLSTATRTALIDGSGTGQVNGNVTMQRYLASGFGYKYFSSPFSTATVNEFSDELITALYRYNENRFVSGIPATGWVNYKTTTNVLEPLAGYAVNFGSSSVANTVDVTGVVNNGNMLVTLYNNNQIYTKGFNLIGNPYPSPIDWYALAGWTKTNIDDALYYFKASTTDQYGGTYSGFVNGISNDPGVATNIIPSMQAFFVHVTDGTFPVTASLSMNNSVRITDQTHSFIKSGVKSGIPFLRLIAGYSDDPTSYDPLVIYFDEKATYNFDGQLDALKLFNTDLKVTNFYSFGNDGSRLSINALPMTSDILCTIRLGLKTEKNGDVIFSIRDLEGIFYYSSIYISDVITGTNQYLYPGMQYKVNLTAGDYQNRFFLNLSNLITDSQEFTSVPDWFSIYSSHGILKTEINLPSLENGTLTICNLTGQTLFINKIYEAGYHEFRPGVKDGIYIVTFISGDRMISKKIFIQSQ